MGGEICQGVCKGSKVVDASAENLVAPALADLFGLASEVLLHRGVAFRVRQLIGVNVADRADDTASQLGFVRLGPLRKAAPLGLVRKGHRIKKGVQRPLDELDEWFLDRVLARAAKHCVLEDVGDAGRSRPAASEGDTVRDKQLMSHLPYCVSYACRSKPRRVPRGEASRRAGCRRSSRPQAVDQWKS